jgi:hypothetical protein
LISDQNPSMHTNNKNIYIYIKKIIVLIESL